MTKQWFADTVGWGFILWLIGYILGFVFYFILPPAYIGWAIMPIGIAITLGVLVKKIKPTSFNYYLRLAMVWTAMAIILDYLLIVKALKPGDGYYKLDVYFYYATTFILPLLVGWKKPNKPHDQLV